MPECGVVVFRLLHAEGNRRSLASPGSTLQPPLYSTTAVPGWIWYYSCWLVEIWVFLFSWIYLFVCSPVFCSCFSLPPDSAATRKGFSTDTPAGVKRPAGKKLGPASPRTRLGRDRTSACSPATPGRIFPSSSSSSSLILTSTCILKY